MADTISNTTTNKRKRVEEASEPAVAPVANATRSDIWFMDGNIVIQAEGVQFKVTRGVLAAQSSIFEDMFSIPQPPSEKEMVVEGCPVVHLSDSAADVNIVLRALFLRGFVNPVFVGL